MSVQGILDIYSPSVFLMLHRCGEHTDMICTCSYLRYTGMHILLSVF